MVALDLLKLLRDADNAHCSVFEIEVYSVSRLHEIQKSVKTINFLNVLKPLRCEINIASVTTWN